MRPNAIGRRVRETRSTAFACATFHAIFSVAAPCRKRARVPAAEGEDEATHVSGRVYESRRLDGVTIAAPADALLIAFRYR